MNEHETCRDFVIPLLDAAGWRTAPAMVYEQLSITDGRIVGAGKLAKRRAPRRADYVLAFAPDFYGAVVEAKRRRKSASDGLEQGKWYAQRIDVPFVYSTNGKGIVEFDALAGTETTRTDFPAADELLARLVAAGKLDASVAATLRQPVPVHYRPRYYQVGAINAALNALLTGDKRVLLTLATGTGKTIVAFQIAWRLWQAGWNLAGEPRKPRILFLADRSILVDDPMSKTFAPFGDARHKLEGGAAVKTREMYFALYQALTGEEDRPDLYRAFAPDFFDLVIVDECHRGSARDNSVWRDILAYFEPAAQVGMTATPLREESRDTYRYFGNPAFTYSLRNGIDDGFLAPYTVKRVVLDVDVHGWTPTPGEVDEFGREIPEGLYTSAEFEKAIRLKARTRAIARRVTDFMKDTDRHAKTIVFCVDQEHAAQMRQELTTLNSDLVKSEPNYVARITANEGEWGRALLSSFQDVESTEPIVVTTSQLLTTGVDIPTCTNIVIARTVRSMAEFKQILGRGTRLRDDYGKLTFNVLDFTGSATELFADPDFDGEPVLITEEELTAEGQVIEKPAPKPVPTEESDDFPEEQGALIVEGGPVAVESERDYFVAPDGQRYDASKYGLIVRDRLRDQFPTAAALRHRWADVGERDTLLDELGELGIDPDRLASVIDQEEADPLDVLTHVGFDTSIRSRRERAQRARDLMPTEFAGMHEEAIGVLDALLDKYVDAGLQQFTLPDILKVPPISSLGSVTDIIRFFGGTAEGLRLAVNRLQELLYQ